MPKFAMDYVEELVYLKFIVNNYAGLEEETPTFSDRGLSDSKILRCQDYLEHGTAQPWELAPSRQDVTYTSAKPREQVRTSTSFSVGSADWYVCLKRNIVTVVNSCNEKSDMSSNVAPVSFTPKHLSPSMEKHVKAALKPGPPEEVLAQGFNLVVTRADISTLRERHWLNDTIINFYMNMLVERSGKAEWPRIYAFNTFFFTKLRQSGHAGLKRWTRKIDLFSYDLVLVPIHLNSHWFLAVIDFRPPSIAIYDSLGATPENASCIDLLKSYLEEESRQKRNTGIDWDCWQLVVVEDLPLQDNENDCGIFICQYAECISRDAHICFGPQHMTHFRKQIVYEILHKELM